MSTHKRDPHDRAGIVAKATEILDNYGLADLTMRRLARELDVTVGALYWHFTSKQELLGAVADELLRPAVDASAGVDADWRARMTESSGRLRNAHQVEALTANLISVNRRHKTHAGVRVTGV